ncbi:DUF6056 family protein [Puia sp. P3]|uniref:DUF6056 family protein n=1 Tax=Puia sp. P3 TaxID=3423952 RepID=UPI003D6667D3
MARKTIYNILIISAGYVLLPFLYIARYDHPSAEDFLYSVEFSKHGIWYVVKQDYLNWSGRYLSRIIWWLTPTRYHSLQDYRIAAGLMILLFAGSVIIMIRGLTRGLLSTRQALALSALLIGLYFSKAPAISEGFYWFSSYSIYQLANVLTMLLLVAVVRLRRPSVPGFLLCAILCIAIIGCNEVSLIITVLFIHFYTIGQYLRSRRLDPWLAALCIVCIVAALAEIAAPGNYNRLNGGEQFSKSLSWTVAGALSISAVHFSQWIAPVLVAFLVYVPLFGAPIAQKIKNADQYPEASVKSWGWFFVCTLGLLLLFVVWTAGGSNLGRIFDVIYLFFLLGCFFILQLVLNRNEQLVRTATQYSSALGWLGLTLLLALLLDVNNNVSTAYVDIVAGKAEAYDRDLKEREVIVSQCHSDSCRVPSLTVVPSTIFFTDIHPLSEPSGLWVNDFYSKYLNAGFVVPDKAAPAPARNIEALRDIGRTLRQRMMK